MVIRDDGAGLYIRFRFQPLLFNAPEPDLGREVMMGGGVSSHFHFFLWQQSHERDLLLPHAPRMVRNMAQSSDQV